MKNNGSAEKAKRLGILGGLGPMATAYFFELITEHTKAGCDQEHIDVIISSRASTPDRTAFITGRSEISPLPAMTEELRRLEKAGAELIVMPCNTAHFFYDELAGRSRVPMLDIIAETLRHCAENGVKRAGLLATEGTVSSGAYGVRAAQFGITIAVPGREVQDSVNRQIYGRIKKNLPPDAGAVSDAADELISSGCDTVILGCTELSLMRRDALRGDARFTDSMEALAYSAIRGCGKTPCGFDGSYR